MRQRISRRTVLRGLGAAVALPMLDVMLPRSARAADAGEKPPVRMAFLYVPNGMHMPAWMPEQEGPLEKLPPTLEPLAKFKSHLTTFGELTLNGARALGDGGGDHARSVAAFLTGAHPVKTDGKDIRNGVSIDQVAAAKLGGRTRFPSLELGCEGSAQGGRCDSGYSCAYTSNMAWRTPTVPVAKETDPRAVFDRLVGADDVAQGPTGSRRDGLKKSVLDVVAEDAQRLQRQLGAADRRKLDEYLHAVRQIERRVTDSGQGADPHGAPTMQRPSGKPGDFDEHVRLMLDLLTLAFRTDATRVVTFMFTNAGSNRNYPQVGVSEGHHNLSHHGGSDAKQKKIAKINRHHVTHLAYLLDKLRSLDEGGASLLDNAMIIYGSGIGDGNRHNHDNLPILLAGRGGGAVNAGRHLVYPDETPLCNLYVAMLDLFGASVDKLGDSTGRLERLA